MDELTIADLDGRRICERLGSRAARSYKYNKYNIAKKTFEWNATNQEATVECFSALPFDGVVSSPPLGRVGTTARLPLHLRGTRILLGSLIIQLFRRSRKSEGGRYG